jgi:hypothetical protein
MVVHTKLEAAHDPFDDLVDVDREFAHCARGDGATARLVTRKACAIEQQH